MSGTILPFSSKQIELVSTLDLLFGRSGLSFFQNKPSEQLEETDAASKQKSLTDSFKVHAFERSMMINITSSSKV